MLFVVNLIWRNRVIHCYEETIRNGFGNSVVNKNNYSRLRITGLFVLKEGGTVSVQPTFIQEFLDKQAITEVIYKVARATDRCDESLLRSCFHPEATEDHGVFKGTASEFVDWIIPRLYEMKSTMHSICNVLIECKGDHACSESYFIAHHTLSDDNRDVYMIAAGRYLDQFERRDDEWRLNHRHVIYDWNRSEDSTDIWSQASMNNSLQHGQRGQTDVSYQLFNTLREK